MTWEHSHSMRTSRVRRRSCCGSSLCRLGLEGALQPTGLHINSHMVIYILIAEALLLGMMHVLERHQLVSWSWGCLLQKSSFFLLNRLARERDERVQSPSSACERGAADTASGIKVCLKNLTQAMAEIASPSTGTGFAQFGALGSEEAVARSHLNTVLTLRRSTSHHTAAARRLLHCQGARLGPKAASDSGAGQSPGGNPNPQMEA